MKGLPVSRAAELAIKPEAHKWLVEDLWAEQAVGILGGEPKCCKSFLALDIAVSVASGKPCLRQFPVTRTGPVLVFPAEDALPIVRERIDGICRSAGTDIAQLPLFVITAPRLLLDLPQDRERLRHTVAEFKPTLLVLDPFIRLHRSDENASREIAPLLGYLRDLQREFHTAVLLVHHVRKGSARDRPGQALRGSSDLHGWGDSNLYLRRKDDHFCLAIEHRAAPAAPPVPLQLLSEPLSTALAVIEEPVPVVSEPESASLRIKRALVETDQPLSTKQLQKRCRIRTATLCKILAHLVEHGHVQHDANGYTAAHSDPPFPVSLPAPL